MDSFAVDHAYAARGLPSDGTITRMPSRSLRPAVRLLRDTCPSIDHHWDELSADAAEPNVFAERWFVQAAAAHLPQGTDARTILVWDESKALPRLIGSFPISIGTRYGRLPLYHVTSWTHHHGFLGTPLVRRGFEAAAWGQMLNVLDNAAWALGLLHVTGLVDGGSTHAGLIAAAAALRRPCDTVHRIERAFLRRGQSSTAYYEATVRAKKRKELRRLRSRLDEIAAVSMRRLAPDDDLASWCNDYLELEASGWKGQAGSAMAADGSTDRFFREVAARAHASGRLEMIRLDVDGRAIAILVNLFAAPGAFSFKIAYDEAFARFSPGVLIELENYAILDRSDISWMDSCAVEDHPMINSLWAERRAIVRVSVPLAGWRRRGVFRLARTAENLAARARRGNGRKLPKGGMDT